ncbi:hypothetical protein J0J80_07025 [Turicibacter bilis]|uniref:hypothetical protein n=1 Tax=Turicibacter TaxID=191303 RepID=UPI0006BED381|nr:MULTISPECIES: hypothetical protein [Turicibacter]MDD5983953.1 hypothetical protein [Turicibacter sp.]CUO34442.1 Uncharacterised protein [Turicibacter sanguinis]AMC08980.1 hypothetical protein AT726_08795 [Turicibacter sp. H121]MBS3203928.1 hypothetical protein [Turicibacter bilis]MCU7199923.1 hypothetical protein [Turicibacter sp. H121]
MKDVKKLVTFTTNNHVAKSMVSPASGKIFYKEGQLVVRKHGFKNGCIDVCGFKTRDYKDLNRDFGYGRRMYS